jgi:hypothetical protein
LFARLEEAAHAHGLVVGLLRGDGFAVFLAGFAAEAEFGAAQRRQDAIAGAVGEKPGCHHVPRLGRRLVAAHGGDAAAVHAGGGDGAVEQQRQVRLGARGGVERGVPERIAGVGVAAVVVEEQFLDDAGLAAAGAMRAADVHADLGRGVSAKDRPVLDQGDGGAAPRRGQRRAQAGHAAAADAEIHLVTHFAHGPTSQSGKPQAATG